MMSHFSDDLNVWLCFLSKRIQSFQRDTLFELTATESRIWWAELIEEALTTEQQIRLLLDQAKASKEGCLEAAVVRPRRISVRGKQIYAYQLVYWAGNALIPSDNDVVRHKCHNRLCVNPQHLTHGTQLENVNDTRDR